MSDVLIEALEMLDWGARQSEQSASLSPAECRAILDELQRNEPAPLTDLLEDQT